MESTRPKPPGTTVEGAGFVEEIAELGIFSLSTDGRVVTWNKGAAALTAWPASEIIGEPFDVLFPAREREEGEPGRILKSSAREGSCDARGWRQRRGGERFYGFGSITRLLDSRGGLRGYAGVLGDITALRLAESHLAEALKDLAARNSDLEQFAYAVSHDLKSPLVTISGFTNHIREAVKREHYEQISAYSDRVCSAVTRMRDTIDDLLRLCSVGKTVAVAWIDAAAAVRRVQDELSERLAAKGARIVIHEPMPPVYADPIQFSEVIENILVNAIKYGCPRAGMDIEVGGSRSGRQVTYYVRDQGPGIAPEARARAFGLFQRFNTRDPFDGSVIEGTGVGLAIVKRVMDRAGGNVWIEETPGGGATFLLAFPADAPAADASAGGSSPGSTTP